MRIDHPLQGGSQQSGGDPFAADVGQHHCQSFLGIHGVIKIAANFLAGKIFSAQPGKRHLGNFHLHQPLLHARGDAQLLLVAARLFLGLHQPGILNQGRGFCRDRVQNVAADRGNVAGCKARIHIQHAHGLRRSPAGRRGLRVACGMHRKFAQRNTDHGAQIVGHNALPSGHIQRFAGVLQQEFQVGSDRFFENGMRNRLIVQQRLFVFVPPGSQTQFAIVIFQKHVRAFRAG